MDRTGESLDATRDARSVLTVSELNHEARSLLERGLGRLWVEGEVSNLARPASGHLYFSLKDEKAQVRCAWFRQRQPRGSAAALANGDQLLAFGRISLYEPRGDYQLIVEQVEVGGEGELLRQFEALKKKLAAEGLFDETLKRPLPSLPRRIGVITSPSGAAVRDILTVLGRRFAAVPLIVYPAAVQGEPAAAELVAALETAARRNECDVLIIGRGGGSLEDLMAFNDEALARAIRRSPIPVISAVGHEVDFSISDLVADRRAPTPSGAAELAVPDQAEWLRGLALDRQRLVAAIARRLDESGQGIDWLARRLDRASPATQVERRGERLAALRNALGAAALRSISLKRQRLDAAARRLSVQSPAARLERIAHRLERVRAGLGQAAERRLERLDARLRIAGRALEAVSPLATLERGYAIVTDVNSGRVLTSSADASAGDEISARLADGTLSATVTGSKGGK